MKRKILAGLLSLCMMVSLFPTGVFAEAPVVEDPVEETIVEETVAEPVMAASLEETPAPVAEYGVAKIGNAEFATLAEAAAAAKAGDEIVLLSDVTLAEALILPADVIFNGNGNQINGTIVAGGDLTFKGHTKVSAFTVDVTGLEINIIKDACLEVNGSGRMAIGHNTTFNITGDIDNAKTADVANLTPSLVMPGVSFTGAGVTFNATNAYIKTTASYSSSSKSASGTFDFNINNSIWEQFGKLAFESQSTAATVNFDLKDSVLTTTSHLVFGVSRGEVVIDNSNVNVGKSNQIENQSTMTIKNGSVVNGGVATSSNAKNPGTIIVDNATYAVTGEFSGSDLGTGTIIVKKGATVSAGSITKANIVIDAAGMTADDTVNLTANLKNHVGTFEVVNNETVIVEKTETGIVLKPAAAQANGTAFATLAAAIEAANGTTVTLLADAAVSEGVVIPAGKTVTLDLNGKDIVGTTNAITNNGTLTINDTVGTGNVYTTDVSAQGRATVVNKGTLTINAGWFGDSNNDTTDRNAINRGNAIKNYGVAEINGGYFTNVSNQYIGTDAYAYAINTLTGGTTTINNATVYGDINGLVFSDGKTIVNDGSFTLGRPNEENNLWYLAYGDVEIKGGTWNRAFAVPSWNTGDPKFEGAVEVSGGNFNVAVPEKYIAEGYIVVENTDGTYGIKEDLKGTGTEADPYLISNLEDLISFRDYVNGGRTYDNQFVKLTANIDLKGESWTPIGNGTNKFLGTFDGGNNTISNLVVDVETNNAGLFGFASVIKNVKINNATVKGVISVGSLVGELESSVGTVDNCHVTGVIQVTGENSVGALAGKGYANIKNSSVNGTNAANSFVLGVYGNTEEGDNIGGIIGHLGEGNTLGVSNSKAENITVKGTRKVGGIVGTTARGNDIIGNTAENIVVESTATAEYADDNASTTTIGSIVGNYFGSATSGGILKDNTAKNATLIIGNAKSAGVLVGGDRVNNGGAPAGIEASGNKVFNIEGATNNYYGPVAQVGDEQYTTLEAAIEAANGTTVTLLADITVSEGIVIPADKTVTLDLNGKTVSMTDASAATSYLIKNNGNLTVTDTTEAKSGKLTFVTTTPSASNGYASNTISNYGTITVKAGTIENTSTGGACYALDNYAGSTATIEGGKLTANKTAVRIFNWTEGDAAKATLNINGGEIYSKNGYGVNLNMGNAPSVALNINGGTITTDYADYNLAVYIVSKGDAKNVVVNVKNGTLNGEFALNGITSTTMVKGNVSISGGTIKGVTCYDTPAFGFITGGTFAADPSDYLATGYKVTASGNSYKVVKNTPAPTTKPSSTTTPEATPAPTATPTPTPAPTTKPTTAPAATPAPTATPEATPAPEMPKEADTTITEVVAKEEVVEAVKETVTVTEGTATVEKETVEAVIEATEEDAPVVLPLVQATEETEIVNKAEVATEALEAVVEAEKDVVIELTDVTVMLDAEAVKAITEQADGATIEIRAVKTEKHTLTEKQQATLADKDTAIVVTAQIFSDGEYIGDFKGGKATIMLPFQPEEGRAAEDYAVYFIDDHGELVAVPAEYVDGYMVFTTVHFSDYVIVYEGEALGGSTEIVVPEAPAAESGFPVLPIAIVIAIIIIGGVIILMKKKNAEE